MLLKKAKKKIGDVKPSKKINARSNNGRQKKFSTKENEATALKKDVDKNKRSLRRGKEEEKPKEIENKNKTPLKMTRSVSGLKSEKMESALNQHAVEKSGNDEVKNDECMEIVDSENELIDEKGKKKKQKLENENRSEYEKNSESDITTPPRVNKTTAVNLNKSNRSQPVEKGKTGNSVNGLKKGSNRELTDGLDKQSNGCTVSKDGQDKKKGKKEIHSKTNKHVSSTKGETNLHNGKTKEKETVVENVHQNVQQTVEPNSVTSVKPQRVSMRIKKRAEQAENAKNAEKNKEESSSLETYKGYRLAVEGLRKRLVSSSSVDVDKMESGRRRSGRKRKGSEEDVKQEIKKETKSDVKQETVSTSTKKKGGKVEEQKIEKESSKKKKKGGASVPEEGKKGKTGTIQTKKDVHKKELEKTDSPESVSKEKKKTGTEEHVETKKELEKPAESQMKQNENDESDCKGNEPVKGDDALNSVVMGSNKDALKSGVEKKSSGNTHVTKEKTVEDSVKKSGSKQDRLSSGVTCNNVKQGTKGTEMTTESNEQTKKITTEKVPEEKKKEIVLAEDVIKKKVKSEKVRSVSKEKKKKETEGSNNSALLGVKIEAPIVEKRRGRKRKIQGGDDILNKLKNIKEKESEKENTFRTCEEEKAVVADDIVTGIRSNGFIDRGTGNCDGLRQKGSGRRSLLRTTFLCDKEGHMSSEQNKEDKTLFGLSKRKLKEESDELYTLHTDSVLNTSRNKRKYVKKRYRKRYMDLLHEKSPISNVRNNLFQSSLSRRVSNVNTILRNNRIGNKPDKKKSKNRLFPNETFMSKKEFLTNVNSINTVYNFNEEFLNFLCTVSNCDDIQYQPMLQFLGTIQMNLSKNLSKEYSSEFLEKHNVGETVQMMEHLVHILNNNNDILNKLNQLEYKFFNDLLEKMDDQHCDSFDGFTRETVADMREGEVSNNLTNLDRVKLQLRDFFQKGKGQDNSIISNSTDYINKEFIENENNISENKPIENIDLDTSVRAEKMTREEEGTETNAAKIAYSQTTYIELNTLSSTYSPAHTNYEVEKEVKNKSKEDCMFHVTEGEKSDHWYSSECAFNEKEQVESQNKFMNKWTDKECLKKIDTICKKFNGAIENMLKNENGLSSRDEINKYINGEKECLFKNYISTTVYKDNNMMKSKSNMLPTTPLTNYNVFEQMGGTDDVFLEKYVQLFKKNNYINAICDELIKDNVANKSPVSNNMEMKNSLLCMNEENVVDSALILENKNEDTLYSLNNDNSNNDDNSNDVHSNDVHSNDVHSNDVHSNDINSSDNNSSDNNSSDDNSSDENKENNNKENNNKEDNNKKDNNKKDNNNTEKEHENFIKTYKNCIENNKNIKESLIPIDPLTNTINVLEDEIRVHNEQTYDEQILHEQKNEISKEEHGLMKTETNIVKEEHSQQCFPEQCENKNVDLIQEFIKDQGEVLNHDDSNGKPSNGYIQHTGIFEIENENEHTIKKYYSDTIALNSSISLSSELTHNKLFDSNTTDKEDNKLLWGEKNACNKKQMEEVLQKEDEKEERNKKYDGLVEVTKHFNSESTICLENWDERLEQNLQESTILDNKEVLLRGNSVDFAKNESITYTSTEHVESHTTASLQEELRVSKATFIDSRDRMSGSLGCNNINEECLLGVEVKEEEQNIKCASTCTKGLADSKKRFHFLKDNFIHTYNDNTIADLLAETFNLKDENSVFFNSAGKSSKEILDCLYMISKIKKTVFDECTKMINNQIFFLEKNFQVPNCNLSIVKNSFALNNTK